MVRYTVELDQDQIDLLSYGSGFLLGFTSFLKSEHLNVSAEQLERLHGIAKAYYSLRQQILYQITTKQREQEKSSNPPQSPTKKEEKEIQEI